MYLNYKTCYKMGQYNIHKLKFVNLNYKLFKIKIFELKEQ